VPRQPAQVHRGVRPAAARGGPFRAALSVALLDLDNAKRVNDRYRHAVGDATPQRLSALLYNLFRAEDIVGRSGNCARPVWDVARRGMARVASALEALREETFTAAGQPPVRVRFDACVAQHGLDGTDLRSLREAADDVLYRAKQEVTMATMRASRPCVGPHRSRHPLCVIPEGAGPVKWAGSCSRPDFAFSHAVWVNASEAWGSRIGRKADREAAVGLGGARRAGGCC
jgi:diguanylate cyclase (GGDEF)-like protein